VHPDSDLPQTAIGLRVSSQGDIALIEGSEAVRQSILLLFSTIPGERVMRPEYGCELYRLVFSPNDDTTAGLAIHYVRRALERWEPRVDIVHLDARRNPERPELLDILLEYRVRALQRQEQLVFSVDLSGEGL
jgi:hypothetical protein